MPRFSGLQILADDAYVTPVVTNGRVSLGAMQTVGEIFRLGRLIQISAVAVTNVSASAIAVQSTDAEAVAVTSVQRSVVT